MFTTIEPLREPLLAARLLREEILAAPVRPDLRGALTAGLAAAAGDAWRVLTAAAEHGSLGVAEILSRADLNVVAESAGGTALRTGPGVPFHGQAAPPPARVPGLLDEVLETVNAPKALESWSPVLRAFALHFLLRLVQPYEADAALVGWGAEALVLASDGFDARRMRLAPPTRVGRARDGRTDPDSFALDRLGALVEALGETRSGLREATARAVVAGWSAAREAGLNERQQSLVDWLLPPGRALHFDDYVGLHGGRAGPSLRTLQRDWAGLRDGGWIVAGPGGTWELSSELLDWGA